MNCLDEIIRLLPMSVKIAMSNADYDEIRLVTEIRIRRNRQVALVVKNNTYFLADNGKFCDYPVNNSIIVNDEEFDELFLRLCNYSIHTCMKSLVNGYVTLDFGARVGIASTAVFNDGSVTSVKDVTSLCIRIPNQCRGCSINVLDKICSDSITSVIVAGLPNAGKTTFLRDMAYQLSNGYRNRFAKVAIVDERNEISAKNGNSYSLDVGANCDVLTGFDKCKGIEIATRTLSPELIICDEIATVDEVNRVIRGLNSGVRFAVSVHIGAYEDVYRREVIRRLLLSQQFDYLVLLEGYTYEPLIYDAQGIVDEINRTSRDSVN